MAEIALDTPFASQSNRGNTSVAYEYKEVPVAATAGTVVVQAPAGGKLVRAVLSAGAAINATNNYPTIAVVNKSNTDAAMFGTNDTGDGTDTAQYGTRVMVLSSTEANLAVDEGDWLELTTTVQGTLGAASKMLMVFEVTD